MTTKTTTTATKKASSRKTKPVKKAPAAKKQQAPAAPQTQPNRKDLLTELVRLGWDGPTSYTATDLRDALVPWVAAGKPADAANIPAGAMNHAHPALKTTASHPARKAATELRAAIREALVGGDADRVVELAASLKEALA